MLKKNTVHFPRRFLLSENKIHIYNNYIKKKKLILSHRKYVCIKGKAYIENRRNLTRSQRENLLYNEKDIP